MFITFCSLDRNAYTFFGNTYRSGNVGIKTLQSFYIDISEKQYIYFIANNKPTNDTQQSIMALVEVLYVETTDDDRIVSQHTEGWSLLNLNDNGKNNQKLSAHIYGGTPRNLFIKDLKSIY